MYFGLWRIIHERPLCWLSASTQWIPHTKSQWCWKCFHVMTYYGKLCQADYFTDDVFYARLLSSPSYKSPMHTEQRCILRDVTSIYGMGKIGKIHCDWWAADMSLHDINYKVCMSIAAVPKFHLCQKLNDEKINFPVYACLSRKCLDFFESLKGNLKTVPAMIG